MVYNGPWVLQKWKHNSSMKLVKNQKYWNKKKIQIDEIDMPITSESIWRAIQANS